MDPSNIGGAVVATILWAILFDATGPALRESSSSGRNKKRV